MMPVIRPHVAHVRAMKVIIYSPNSYQGVRSTLPPKKMSEQREAGATSEALLRALLRISLEEQRARNEELTIGDQILILQDSGLAQGQAARILGVPRNQIPSYLRNATNKKLLAKLVKKQEGTGTEQG